MIRQLLLFCMFLFPFSLEAYQVLGIGCPTVDIVQPVEEELLHQLHLRKNGWHDYDASRFATILAAARPFCPPIVVPASGSICNTMKGLSALGISTAVTGRVGNDQMGERITESIRSFGITPLFTRTDTPSVQIACLVTPNGERTFCACSAAEKELSANDLFYPQFQSTSLVHIEGFTLPYGSYVENAMIFAKRAGALVSFDVGPYGVKFRERLFALLTQYVDIAFLDEDEAYQLTLLPPERACDFLRNFCKIVVIKVGGEGCWVGSKEGIFHQPAIPAKVVDTTGAGDLFAAAFLYGVLKEASLQDCARFGNFAGNAAVQQYGGELPQAKWGPLKKIFAESLAGK